MKNSTPCVRDVLSEKAPVAQNASMHMFTLEMRTVSFGLVYTLETFEFPSNMSSKTALSDGVIVGPPAPLVFHSPPLPAVCGRKPPRNLPT